MGWALTKKLKLLTLSRNCENMVGNKKKIFGTTSRTGKPHPGKEISQSMALCNEPKSPLRNVFFLVYYKLCWYMTDIYK